MFYQQMQIYKNHHWSYDKNILYNNEIKETLVTGRNDFLVYKNTQFFYNIVSRKDEDASKDEATHLRIFERSIYFDVEWNGQSFDAKFHLFENSFDVSSRRLLYHIFTASRRLYIDNKFVRLVIASLIWMSAALCTNPFMNYPNIVNLSWTYGEQTVFLLIF